MTWPTARDRCVSQGQGARLATITSAEEQAFVAPMATSGGNGTGDLWIGLWRDGGPSQTNRFVWITGESLDDYTNWNANEPNESGSACVRLLAGNGRWADRVCSSNSNSNRHFALCEREPSP